MRLWIGALALGFALATVACNSRPDRRPDGASLGDGPQADAGSSDSPISSDTGASERATEKGSRADSQRKDASTAKPDSATKADAASKPDVASKLDAAQKTDTTSSKPDTTSKADSKNTTGLSVPCKNGPGFTLFRFHYGGTSKSPIIDVWDATCSYSYAPGSACNVYAVYPGFGSVSYTSDGYPILTTSEYLRVRFSVTGLSFSKATVYIQARSYATSSSTYYRIWSPLYGGVVNGPVDNDWIYDWYGLDWSSYLYPSDPPSLTAIQIYADQGSGQLAVKAVELCVQ